MTVLDDGTPAHNILAGPVRQTGIQYGKSGLWSIGKEDHSHVHDYIFYTVWSFFELTHATTSVSIGKYNCQSSLHKDEEFDYLWRISMQPV